MKANSDNTRRRAASLTVRISGPKVGEARLSASDLAEIIKRTQQALQRVGQVLYGEQSRGRGRKRREIEELCELYLVAWENGSAVACLDLAEPPEQSNLFEPIGEESVRAFVEGLAVLSSGLTRPAELPKGFDTGVLQTCDHLGRTLDHGIDKITYVAGNGVAPQQVCYDASLRRHVRTLLGEPAEGGLVTKVGSLEMLSGHRRLTGTLWEPNGGRWKCLFTEEQRELLRDAWMHTVKVVGNATSGEGHENTLEVQSIVPMDDGGVTDAAASETMPFWRALSLGELAEAQHVDAVQDLDTLSALWPEDDDPDELLGYILGERQERRKRAAQPE